MIPFMILMGGVKILLSFNYPAWQYTLIGFPEDPYGYNREERSRLAGGTIKYLTSDQNIATLMELKDYEGLTVYTPNEVSHLQDVKNVINWASLGWYVVLGLSFAFLIWMLVTKSFQLIRRAFFWGAVLTLLLMLSVVVLMSLNFNSLFEKFHAIFFPQGNWTFTAESGLIRLFPLPLWVNAFILVSVFSLLVSILLLVLFWPRKRKLKEEERVIPTAIPSSRQELNIPSMASPVNPVERPETSDPIPASVPLVKDAVKEPWSEPAVVIEPPSEIKEEKPEQTESVDPDNPFLA